MTAIFNRPSQRNRAAGRSRFVRSSVSRTRLLSGRTLTPPRILLSSADALQVRRLPANFPEAQASLQKALALNPNSAYAHQVSCWLANEMGTSSDAISECRKAVELDPLSLLNNTDLADTYYKAREYDKSLEQANRTLELDQRYSQAIKEIAYVYEVTGNYKGAIEEWIKNEQVLGNEQRAEELRRVFEKSGYSGYLRKDAKDLETQGDFYDAAVDHALLGEKDSAFADLERAAAAGQQLDAFKLDPELDNLRSDPRYADLLRRIGLPQ